MTTLKMNIDLVEGSIESTRSDSCAPNPNVMVGVVPLWGEVTGSEPLSLLAVITVAAIGTTVLL